MRSTAADRRKSSIVAEREIMRFAVPDAVTGLRPHALWHKHVPTGFGRRKESRSGTQILWFDTTGNATTITNSVDGYGAFVTAGAAADASKVVG